MAPKPLIKAALFVAASSILFLSNAIPYSPTSDDAIVAEPRDPGRFVAPIFHTPPRGRASGSLPAEVSPMAPRPPVWSVQSPDTYVVAEFSFDGPFGADTQGWVSVDITEPAAGPFFHVDSVLVPTGGGSRAMWCGARPDSTTVPFCSYACLPGYGNVWSEILETPDGFDVTGDVTLSFLANWDTEPAYDFIYVEYLDKNSTWQQLDQFDGVGSDVILTYNVPEAQHNGSVKFRIRFESDEAYSDEDCIFDTDGAIQVDNATVSDGTGVVHAEDFESEPIGATQTDDGVWVAKTNVASAYGDFAGLFDTGDLHVECENTRSHVWGFFKDSPDIGGCDPPWRPVVPYRRDGLYLHNEIWSPPIDLNHDIDGQPIPPTASKTRLEYDVYRDLGFIENGILYRFRIGSHAAGAVCPSLVWNELGFFWMVGHKEWTHQEFDVDDHIVPDAEEIRIAFGVWDAYQVCSSYPECDMCHTISPLFDDVRLLRLDPKGLQWSADPVDMFHDNFPADGTTAGLVRMDSGRRITTNPIDEPGDSAVVGVWDEVDGLMMEPSTGTPAVYIHVRSSGGQYGPAVLGENTPYLSDDGEWTVGVCLPARDQGGAIVADMFACDLNDSLFVPGDSVSFYFSAINGIGTHDYFSLVGGAVASEAAARQTADEAQCLPTGESNILYVDDAEPDDLEGHFDNAFRSVGLDPDRYDVRGTFAFWPGEFCHLGRRAVSSQIVNVYRTIVWSGGNNYKLQAHHEVVWQTADSNILLAFVDSTTQWDPGLYITSNNIAGSLYKYRGGATSPTLQLLQRLGLGTIEREDRDHTGAGEPVSPTVYAAPSSIFDHTGDEPPGGTDVFICSNYLCREFGGFDVLETGYGGEPAMYYSDNPVHIATVINEQPNTVGKMYRCVTDGFGLERIIDDGVGSRPDRIHHMQDILEFLRGGTLNPTGVETPNQCQNALYPNYPNPFNPVTTIRYSIRGRVLVSLRIYNVAGQLVRTLADEVKDPESEGHTIEWDGTDDQGRIVASGVYFCRLSAGSFEMTRKMVVIR